MRLRRTLELIALIVALSGATVAQTSASSDASKKWPAFWQQFSAAIKKKDVATIRKAMPDDFFDGGGGMTPAEWLNYINENERKGSWKDIQSSMAKGTIVSKEPKGPPSRQTRDKHYYFEFRKGRWYFAGVAGD